MSETTKTTQLEVTETRPCLERERETEMRRGSMTTEEAKKLDAEYRALLKRDKSSLLEILGRSHRCADMNEMKHDLKMMLASTIMYDEYGNRWIDACNLIG
jgi:hypothetical protein